MAEERSLFENLLLFGVVALGVGTALREKTPSPAEEEERARKLEESWLKARATEKWELGDLSGQRAAYEKWMDKAQLRSHIVREIEKGTLSSEEEAALLKEHARLIEEGEALMPYIGPYGRGRRAALRGTGTHFVDDWDFAEEFQAGWDDECDEAFGDPVEAEDCRQQLFTTRTAIIEAKKRKNQEALRDINEGKYKPYR